MLAIFKCSEYRIYRSLSAVHDTCQFKDEAVPLAAPRGLYVKHSRPLSSWLAFWGHQDKESQRISGC